MTRYSSYQPMVERRKTDSKYMRGSISDHSFVPVILVGAAVAAALMVLLLLTQSQLSQISFEISALEQELNQLKRQQEKLLVEHARVYSLDRIEAHAVNELGMIHPTANQIRYIDIDTVDSNRLRTETGICP